MGCGRIMWWSAREGDIFGSIAAGHSIRQTARMLRIAANTNDPTTPSNDHWLARPGPWPLPDPQLLGKIVWYGGCFTAWPVPRRSEPVRVPDMIPSRYRIGRRVEETADTVTFALTPLDRPLPEPA